MREKKDVISQYIFKLPQSLSLLSRHSQHYLWQQAAPLISKDSEDRVSDIVETLAEGGHGNRAVSLQPLSLSTEEKRGGRGGGGGGSKVISEALEEEGETK